MNMVVYTLEQRWEVRLRSIYRRCRFWQKKIVFSDEAHCDLGGYVNKQNCLIWGLNNAGKYCNITLKIMVMLQNVCENCEQILEEEQAKLSHLGHRKPARIH